jgi:hypothetical protein
MPANWFPRESHAVLTAFVRSVVKMDVLAVAVDRFGPEDICDEDGLKRYEKLLTLAAREARTMTTLAQSMRLTQLSRYQANQAEKKSGKSGVSGVAEKPWKAAA